LLEHNQCHSLYYFVVFPAKIRSLNRLPKFHYLYFDVASVEAAFVFPHDLWINVSNSHSTGTIHAALTALHRKLSLSAPHGRE
jgi:hypothetical protein